MKIFIRSASAISPQETFDHNLFVADAKTYNNNCLDIIEPNYANILDARQRRRMNKVVRIGVAAALKCLQDVNEKNIDAVVTGTAYGCMEDSEEFLKNIVLQDEQMLSPTAFIQLTQNSVAAQIALLLKCHSYNNTFVHRGFSFEYALLDAMMLLNENKANNVLAGSADEITEFTISVLKRFGLYKQSPVSNLDLYASHTKGTIAGQGAAFFLLSGQPSGNDLAIIDGIEVLYKPLDKVDIKKYIRQFLSFQKLDEKDVNLVITGRNGDPRTGAVFNELQTDIFKDISCINYKHLCGEYPTASSFAMWLAANIINYNKLPKCFENDSVSVTDFKRVLICNSYQGKYYSLILLSSCNN